MVQGSEGLEALYGLLRTMIGFWALGEATVVGVCGKPREPEGHMHLIQGL